MKDIKGYENLYKINEFGKVFSIRRNKFLKQQLDRYGYLYITLNKDGVFKKHKVHRLVANNFLNNKENKPCVDHIDRNKLNNHYSNLRFVTPKENSNNINTINHLKKIGIKYKTTYGKKIIDKNGIKYISIIEASRKNKISRGTIQRNLKNNTEEWK